ncbi:DoxX family membrane protein [Aquibacillus halophilus]|uniref:DoxX family membrane protein n=1 Tax=Aquibacillus halophilus TaxID=930132 RepID=A0A6A8DHC8_9BACI|nr:DoxX family membrane protein [Aquibacillus halophilus]MRH45105.1 DoxX family membrane protein [Aquibacillus halophilus]
MKKRLYSFIIVVLVLFTPIFTLAHVKWFATVEPQKVTIEQILSPLFITISLFIAILLAVLSQVMNRLMDIPLAKEMDLTLAGWRKYSRYILKYGTAFAFIIQVLSGTMFAPDFVIDYTWEAVLMWIIIVGLLIPHHISTKLAALVMLALFVYEWTETGWFYMLDYGFYIAIIGVLLIGNTKLEKWGFPFLYLGTGLSLCWVAVEKWVYPEMTINIIETHGVPTFGFEPAVFIVLAAFIEFVVGYLLVVGILNRILAIVVTVIFILTTTIFGLTEIIGHAMIHIVLIIFIIEGVSFYHPPIKIHKTTLDQMVFVFLNFIFVLATFILIYYRFA